MPPLHRPNRTAPLPDTPPPKRGKTARTEAEKMDAIYDAIKSAKEGLKISEIKYYKGCGLHWHELQALISKLQRDHRIHAHTEKIGKTTATVYRTIVGTTTTVPTKEFKPKPDGSGMEVKDGTMTFTREMVPLEVKTYKTTATIEPATIHRIKPLLDLAAIVGDLTDMAAAMKTIRGAIETYCRVNGKSYKDVLRTEVMELVREALG